MTLAAGFERWWPTARNGSYAIRSGLSLGDLSRTWHWGVGWKLGGGRADYAMTVPLSGNKQFGHALTISVRFGRSDPEAEYERLLEGEMNDRHRLGQSLAASALRQQELSEEIGRLRDEIAKLKEALSEKRESEDQARRKITELEARHKRAVDSFDKLQAEHARNAAKTKSQLFHEEWAAYQRAKLDGAPDAALLQRLQRLMTEYMDAGVDLGDANQELRRLQQER